MRKRDRGFTLLEILVTLFVLALGVLGTAGLQAFALKLSQGAQLRSQAVVLGLDLLERMEAINPAAIAGNYEAAVLPAASPNDCRAAFCSPSELATYDLVQFKTRVEAQLPGATATVTFTPGAIVAYTVQINWVERIAKGATTTASAGGASNVDATGKTEAFSYTIRKQFFNRATVV